MDGQSVYVARRQMGRILAREAPIDADLVVGVPDSGLPSAMGYALRAASLIATASLKIAMSAVRSFSLPMRCAAWHSLEAESASVCNFRPAFGGY